MITRKQYKSAPNVIAYFDQNLVRADYHTQSGQVEGVWGGHLAKRLGLSDKVHRDDFEKFCNNINPQTDERLTARTRRNRTVAEDWTFSVPKSVSIQYALTQDKDILDCLRGAIHDTMRDVEKDTETRVRMNGRNENRKTGNLLYSIFIHDDTRPVQQNINGIKVNMPDPQLHGHTMLMNLTHDEKEQKWKAVQFRNMVASIPTYRAIFESRLAQRLQKAGYELERTANNFEIAGYKRSTINKFSNRQAVIERKAKEKGITDPAEKAKLGAKTRNGKRDGLSQEALQKLRVQKMDAQEMAVVLNAKNFNRIGLEQEKETTAHEAVNHAIAQSLARKSVVDHKELVQLALKRSLASSSKEQIEFTIAAHPELRSKKTKEETLYTNREAHVEERKLIAEAKNGQNKYRPINPEYEPVNDQITLEQKQAVKHVLNSKDFITMITGRAGTGKTWSVKEIEKGIKETGMNFGAFAPTIDASKRVQREDGFQDATTIAELLKSEKHQNGIRGGMIWVDEGSMVGNKTMNSIIDLAKRQNARILLTGDTRQHHSVERGDAMRVLEKYGQVKPAYLTKNQRQINRQYRQAVQALSEGQMMNGFKILEEMNAIKEAEEMEQVKENVAIEYADAVKANEKALVIATTHLQGQAVTDCIRGKLRENGIIGEEDIPLNTLSNLGWCDVQKKDVVNYQPGQVVEFHQNVKGGFLRGTRFRVKGHDKTGNILLEKNAVAGEKKKEIVLPLDATKHFSVYEEHQKGFAQNDIICTTKTGFSKDKQKHRLESGSHLTFKKCDEEGNIIAQTSGGKTIKLDKEFGHLKHGYYSTSPKAQGRKVNRVIIMQGSNSGKASSMEQFYVSASRGQFSISVHTDDKEQLLNSINQSSKRKMASEVVKEKTDQYQLEKQFNTNAVETPESASQINSNWQHEQSPPTPDITPDFLANDAPGFELD